MTEEEQYQRAIAEERQFWASFGTNQSQRHAFLDAIRAYIVECLHEGAMEAAVIEVIICTVTDRLKYTSLMQILWANAENAWREEDGAWSLNPDSILVAGGIEGTRWDERLHRMKVVQILRGMVARGELERNGSSGKFGYDLQKRE